jgi:hypothetical protein
MYLFLTLHCCQTKNEWVLQNIPYFSFDSYPLPSVPSVYASSPALYPPHPSFHYFMVVFHLILGLYPPPLPPSLPPLTNLILFSKRNLAISFWIEISISWHLDFEAFCKSGSSCPTAELPNLIDLALLLGAEWPDPQLSRSGSTYWEQNGQALSRMFWLQCTGSRMARPSAE